MQIAIFILEHTTVKASDIWIADNKHIDVVNASRETAIKTVLFLGIQVA